VILRYKPKNYVHFRRPVCCKSKINKGSVMYVSETNDLRRGYKMFDHMIWSDKEVKIRKLQYRRSHYNEIGGSNA